MNYVLRGNYNRITIHFKQNIPNHLLNLDLIEELYQVTKSYMSDEDPKTESFETLLKV